MKRTFWFAVMLCLTACAASAASAQNHELENAAATAAPSITLGGLSGNVVAPGAPMTVTVANGPGNRGDWVAFVAIASNTTPYSVYLTGTKTRPAAGLTGATISATAPTTLGSYSARYYANDTYTLLASALFTVQADKPAPSPTPTPAPTPTPTPAPGATLAPIPDEKFLGNTSGKDAVPSPLALPGICRPANAKVPGFDPAIGFICDQLPPGPKGDKGDQGISGTISQGSPVVGAPCSASDSKYDGDPTATTGWIQIYVCLKGAWAAAAKLPLGK